MADFLPNKDELIMRYLDGEMNDYELRNFEDQLAADSQLAAEVDNLRLAIESVKQYGLRQRVRSVRSEMKKDAAATVSKGKVVSMRKPVWYGLSVAASIFLIFIAIEGYKFYKLNSNTIYNEAYISYTISNTRGSDSFTTIEQAYSNKQYQQVIVQSAAQQNITDKDKFLVGLSYLETKNTSQAIKWLTELNTEGNNYKQDAEFYLSLAYLLNKDYDRSINLLQIINSDQQHRYHERVSAGMIRKIKLLKWK